MAHQRDAAPGEQQTECAAGEREHQTLRQQLPGDASAARPHCHADSDLAPPRGAAREQQIGDVGTGHQQEKADGAHQHFEGLLDRSRQLLAQRKNRRPPAAIENRIGLLKAIAESIHLGAHLRNGDAGPYGGNHYEEAAVIDARVGGVYAERDPDIGRAVHHAKSRRHHSHHGVILIVQANNLAGHLAVRAEAAPEAVAQKGGIGTAGLVFIGPEEASHNRLDAEERQESRGNPQGGKFLGVAAAVRVGGEIEVGFLVSADRFECAALLFPGEEVAAGSQHFELILRGILFPDHQQSIGARVGRLEEHGIHHAKDGGSRAQAERQRGQGQQREPGRLEEQTSAVANIAANSVHGLSG